MGTSGKHFTWATLSTMFSLLSLGLLAVATHALPAAEPQVGLPLFGGPLLYHAPNCTTEEDTITTKSCKPVTENVCEDVEIPGSKIEYVDNCRNATVQQCGLQPVEEEGDGVEAERKRREADPQFVYGAPFHPGVLLPRGQDCGGDQHCPEVSAEDLCGVRGRGAQDPEGRLRPHLSPRPGACPVTSYNKNPGN